MNKRNISASHLRLGLKAAQEDGFRIQVWMPVLVHSKSSSERAFKSMEDLRHAMKSLQEIALASSHSEGYGLSEEAKKLRDFKIVWLPHYDFTTGCNLVDKLTEAHAAGPQNCGLPTVAAFLACLEGVCARLMAEVQRVAPIQYANAKRALRVQLIRPAEGETVAECVRRLSRIDSQQAWPAADRAHVWFVPRTPFLLKLPFTGLNLNDYEKQLRLLPSQEPLATTRASVIVQPHGSIVRLNSLHEAASNSVGATPDEENDEENDEEDESRQVTPSHALTVTSDVKWSLLLEFPHHVKSQTRKYVIGVFHKAGEYRLADIQRSSLCRSVDASGDDAISVLWHSLKSNALQAAAIESEMKSLALQMRLALAKSGKASCNVLAVGTHDRSTLISLCKLWREHCLPDGKVAAPAPAAKQPRSRPPRPPKSPKSPKSPKPAPPVARKSRLLDAHVAELAILSVSESGRMAMAQVVLFVARYLLPLSRAKQLQCLSAFKAQPGGEVTERSNLFQISLACGYPLDRSYGELQRCCRALATHALAELAQTAAATIILRDGLAIMTSMYDLLYVTTVTDAAIAAGARTRFGDVHLLLGAMVGAEATPCPRSIAWYEEMYIATYVPATKAKPATAEAPAQPAVKATPGDKTRWLTTPFGRNERKVNPFRARYSCYDPHETVLTSTRAIVTALEASSTPATLQANLESAAKCYGPFKAMVSARHAATVPTADCVMGVPSADNISPPNDRGCAKRILRMQGGDYALPSRAQVQLFSVVADRELHRCGPSLLDTLLSEEPEGLREADDIREAFAIAKSLVLCASGVVIGEAAAGCDVERAERKGKIINYDHFPNEGAWSLAHLGSALPMTIWAPPDNGQTCVRRTRPILLDIISPEARTTALQCEELTPSAQPPLPLCKRLHTDAASYRESMIFALRLAKAGERGPHTLES